MYLAVDMGGTKVLITLFNSQAEVMASTKFPTAENYSQFLKDFRQEFASLDAPHLKAAGVAIPGAVDRSRGVGLIFGNLPWKNVSIARDLELILNCPVVLENDAKAAGFYQAQCFKDDFSKVLYLAIGTGIGVAYTSNGIINTDIRDEGGAAITVELRGKRMSWDQAASGKSIVKRFGKKAGEITDPAAWKYIAHTFSVGIVDLLAVLDVDVIVFGGGVGAHFDKFGSFLKEELNKSSNPFLKIPPLKIGKKPEEAVVYGCLALAKELHAKTR